VPDPIIQEPGDVVIKVAACAICGSDLHLMGGFVPTSAWRAMGQRGSATPSRQ